MPQPKKHASGADRVKAHRAKASGQRVELRLSVDAVERLRDLAAMDGKTPSEVVEEMILDYNPFAVRV